MSGFSPYEWLQDLVAQVPELVQPLIVALAGAVPYIEGEGSAALGVFAGIHPIVAGLAGATGNIIAVVVVVLLSARARTAALAHHKHHSSIEPTQEGEYAGKQSRRHRRLRRWLVRFGVPGASLLGPLALPTHLTAATLVATGVSKRWVILWQVIAIVVWATLLTLAATGLLTAVEAA